MIRYEGFPSDSHCKNFSEKYVPNVIPVVHCLYQDRVRLYFDKVVFVLQIRNPNQGLSGVIFSNAKNAKISAKREDRRKKRMKN